MNPKLFMQIMAPADDAGGNGNGGGGTGDDTGDDTGTGDQRTTLLGAGDDKGAGDDSVWSWGEDLPGTGEAPDWLISDKYKTVTEQAKATKELEAKLGPAAEMLGAPEGEYELPPLPEGVAGQFDREDPMLAKFLEVSKEAGLSQAAVNKIAGPMAMLLATETAASEQRVSEALAAMGTNSAERITQMDTYLVKELGAERHAALSDAVGADVEAYLALEHLVGLAASDAQLSSLPGKQGPGFTKADIIAEEYKVFPEGHNMAGKLMSDHDPEHRAKVTAMWKQLFPGEDTTIVQ